MAWNGSMGASAPKTPPKKAVKISAIHGIVALAAVLAIGAIVYLFVAKKAPKVVVREPVKTNRIEEVSPTVVSTNCIVEETPVFDKGSLSPAWQKYYDGRDTNKWKVVYNPVTKQEYVSRIVKTGLKNAPPPLYSAHALNILDAIAFKPIKSSMPNVRIDERFMRSLQNGLIEKVVISPDDPDDIKARKEGMKELQAELISRLKNGEDLKQLISDSLAERNRIAMLKQMMQMERANMKRNGASQEEIDDFVTACNKRLDEKGATPIMTRAMMAEKLELRSMLNKQD